MTSELFFTLHFEARYSVIPNFFVVKDFYLMGNLLFLLHFYLKLICAPKSKDFLTKIEEDLKDTLKGLSNLRGISKIFKPFAERIFMNIFYFN